MILQTGGWVTPCSRSALAGWHLCIIAMLLTGVVRAQGDTHTAPAPSDRFPLSWYPADSDVTFTTAPQTGAPYTATMVTTFTGMSFGQGTFQARDGAGRRRTETSMPRPSNDGSGRLLDAREVSVEDPVSHCRFTWLEPWIATGEPVATVDCMPRRVHYAKGGLASDFARTQMTEEHPSPNKVVRTEPIGEHSFGDLKAMGLRKTITRTDPATKEITAVVAEAWYSPALNESVALKFAGKPSGMASYELTNVHRGEPDPALFYPPAGYRIVRLGQN